MAAVAMCQSGRCPARRNCLRSAASGTRPADQGQTYLILPDDPLAIPGEGPSETEHCRFFWPKGQAELFPNLAAPAAQAT